MNDEIEEILSRTSISEPSKITNFELDKVEEQDELEVQIEDNFTPEPPKVDPLLLYQARFSCLETWFVRSSGNVKLKCLNRMLEKLKDESHLDVILTSLNYRTDKLRVYSESSTYTNYIYDKTLNDHNRSLEKKFLEETIAMEMSWFDSIQPQQQIECLIELLKISGGGLVNKFFDFAHELKEKRQPKKSKQEDVGEMKTNSSLMHHAMAPLDGFSNSSLEMEIEKRRKILNDALIKYASQVAEATDRIKSPSESARRSPERKSHKKQQKSSAKRSSKGSKKSSKGSKKGKKGSKSSDDGSTKSPTKKGKREITSLDQIQLLPIWIVKKIFSYINPKALKKLEEVNSYWAYVIEDMVKEKTCRQHMNKVIHKMENNVQYIEASGSYTFEKKSHKTSKAQKRMRELVERGAIHPKLRTTDNSKIKNNTLLEKITREGASNFIIPTREYEGFPRNVPVNQTLLATAPYVLTELGKRPFKPKKCPRASTTVTIERNTSNDSVKSDGRHKSGRKNLSLQII